MNEDLEQPVCRFTRLIPDAPEPQRASRAADGKIPIAAYSYCEPLTTASSYGWYFYPPMTFRLLLDDNEVLWQEEDAPPDEWIPVLQGVQFPGFRDYFQDIAPGELAELAPPMMVQGLLPGSVQIWSGWIGRSASGISMLSRGIVNAQNTQPYRNFEGIIETDRRPYLMFTNLQLMRSNSPVTLRRDSPMFQVQPVRRDCYLKPSFDVFDTDALTSEDWGDLKPILDRSADHTRRPGQYAIEARRRAAREIIDAE